MHSFNNHTSLWGYLDRKWESSHGKASVSPHSSHSFSSLTTSLNISDQFSVWEQSKPAQVSSFSYHCVCVGSKHAKVSGSRAEVPHTSERKASQQLNNRLRTRSSFSCWKLQNAFSLCSDVWPLNSHETQQSGPKAAFQITFTTLSYVLRITARKQL